MASVDRTKIHQGPGSLWLGVAVPATGERLTIDINGNPVTPALNSPSLPTLTNVGGGSLAAQGCFVMVTYVNPVGETLPSAEASLNVPASNFLVVVSPQPCANATGYNVYASTASGTETLQNASPIPIGQNWVQSTALTIGPALAKTRIATIPPTYAPPAANTAGPLFGGAVSGATTIVWTPKIEALSADQVTAPIDARMTAEEQSIEAEIMETDYAKFKAYITNGLFMTGTDPLLPSGFQTYEEISFGGLMQVPRMSIAIISPRVDYPGKFVVSQLYQAYQAQALQMPFSRERATTVKVKFNGLGDGTRPVGDQVGKVYRQP